MRLSQKAWVVVGLALMTKTQLEPCPFPITRHYKSVSYTTLIKILVLTLRKIKAGQDCQLDLF